MKFSFIASDGVILDNIEPKAVFAPTTNGEIGVYADHQPLMATIVPWVLKVESKKGKIETYAVGNGVLQTDGEDLTIISEMIQNIDTLDLADIEAKKKEAEEMMRQYKEGNSTISMERYIEIEQNYLNENAKEAAVLHSKATSVQYK